MRKSVSILILLVALVCGRLAAHYNTDLLRVRAAHRRWTTPPLEDAPPLVAFTTVALAGFRGLLADLFWLRISYKQDQGNYYELVQLSDWVTKLEPHSSAIWAFHAWNLAYNISVMLPDVEGRWRWVRHGISLLRDQGLVYNAGDPTLYTELGWLFQHKIGGDADTAHLAYKRKWAARVRPLLGGPYPDYDRLRSDPERVDELAATLKLDLDTMQTIDRRYGPLNWLCPETHAVYWAVRGLEQVPDGAFLPADRMIFQSLATLFRTGGHAWWLESDSAPVAPNPALLPGVLKAYDHALATYDDETVVHAYRQFLYRAALRLYEAGHQAEAKTLYNRLRRALPERDWPADVTSFVRQESSAKP